jgi:cobalt/nickel transport system permease protein
MFDDKPHHADTFLQRMHPGIKLALVISFIVTASIIPPQEMLQLVPAAILLLLLIPLGRIPLWTLFKRFLTLAPFIVLAGISLPFSTPGTVGGTLPLLGWQWTQEGWHNFLILLARSSFSLLTLVLLSLTTDFPALLEALRRMKLPGALINSLGLLYRYLFVLGDEGSRMMRARNSRHLGKRPLREPAVLGGMVGTLWLRSYLRSVRVAHAMEARGGLGGRMLSAQHRSVSAGEWIVLGIGVSFCAALIVLPLGLVGL